MASFVETFTQADGNLASPWFDPGIGQPFVQVKSNKGSTVNNTAFHVALAFHGITVSGNWQIDFDFDGPLIIGAGGCEWGVRSSVDGSGYGGFVGNAIHVYRFENDGTSHTPLTNDARPGSGGAGNLAQHVTMTHTSGGLMDTYLDGVHMGNSTDTTYPSGDLFWLSLGNTSSPTLETTIDNLILKDSISALTTTLVPPRRRRRPGRGLYVR